MKIAQLVHDVHVHLIVQCYHFAFFLFLLNQGLFSPSFCALPQKSE